MEDKRLISDPSLWRIPPRALALGNGEVHVWRVATDLAPPRLKRFQQTLSAAERERARRFYFRKDRDRYVAARGLLRTVLSGYLDVAPNQLRLSCNSHGKPALDLESGVDRLCFNVSHSHRMALIAVMRQNEIGVDIERIRPELAYEMIARRFFSPDEVATLLALPEYLRREAFFTCWTRKEAYLKARGDGLSFPLDQFTVSLVPGDSPALLRVEGNVLETSRWSLHHMCPRPGYVAALAIEGHARGVNLWQWADTEELKM